MKDQVLKSDMESVEVGKADCSVSEDGSWPAGGPDRSQALLQTGRLEAEGSFHVFFSAAQIVVSLRTFFSFDVEGYAQATS